MPKVIIRRLHAGEEDAVLAASVLFDSDPTPESTLRFLAEPMHHLLIAYDADDQPIGFISGVEMTHPDKGTEMFLYELGVDVRARRQGVGRSLVEALKVLARERHCHGMWVLTDTDNGQAQRLYERAGSSESKVLQAFEWRFT